MWFWAPSAQVQVGIRGAAYCWNSRKTLKEQKLVNTLFIYLFISLMKALRAGGEFIHRNSFKTRWEECSAAPV